MHRIATIAVLAGLAVVSIIVMALVISSYPQDSTTATSFIPKADAVKIALNETGLTDSRNEIQQIYTDRFYVDENGQVFRVNLETLQLTSTEGNMSREIEKLSSLDGATHYWIISLYMGMDSGYIVIIDASNGNVKDKSAYI